MNWKMVATESLRNYQDSLVALENLKEQICAVKMQMTTVRSATADGTAVRGGGCSREDALLDCITEHDRLKTAYEITYKRVRAVNRALDALEDEERDVLKLFYIEDKRCAAEAVKEKYDVEKSEAYRMKARALQRFTRLMYGVTET